MKICCVGQDNLPALRPEYQQHVIGGESVQQTLLALALARCGNEVSMVVADLGQPDGAQYDSVRVWKTYAPDAGVPVLRFAHPRWTGLRAALSRADAEIYYTSCAGMHVGLVALFCQRHHRRFVFRCASDTDCDPARLLVRYARDRKLYAYGLHRADAILVQSATQAEALARNFGLRGRVAGMLVERAAPNAVRDIDALWVSNIRQLKRPDRALLLADRLPQFGVHMVGGPLVGEESLYQTISRGAAARPNVTFHGRLAYWDANALYDRARLFVNTSDIEGFPNSYLQAWVRGVPVVTLIDPDRVIEREGLGVAAKSATELIESVRRLLDDGAAWQAASARCSAYMTRHYGEATVLADYIDAFERVLHHGRGVPDPIAAREVSHV